MKIAVLTVLLTVVVLLILGALAGGAVATTGVINVAATADYLPGAKWFFGTLSESSIRRHAKQAVSEGRVTPPDQITQAMVDNGRHHFVEMCVICHGAPGVERGEVGQGLKPRPPELSHAAQEFSISEIYWVLENGIRHTGMPAYGETHSADELWGLAAFVEELETMTPEEYARETSRPKEAESSSSGDGESGHDHSGHTH